MRWVPVDVAKLWPLALQDSGANLNRSQSLDPYVAWGAATDFSGFTTNGQFRRPPGETFVSVLIRLREGVKVRSLKQFFKGSLYVPFAYSRPRDLQLADTRHLTARIQLQHLWKLRTCTLIEAWELGVARLTALDEEGVQRDSGLGNFDAVAAAAAAAAAAARSPSATASKIRDERLRAANAKAPKPAQRIPGRRTERGVIGVIDYGFAIFNQQFRSANGRSRLRCLWDQHQRSQGPDDVFWKASGGFGYGREFKVPNLVPWLTDSPADELQAYRDLGYLHQRADPLRSIKMHSHGTHVLDVAAGLIDRWSGEGNDPASQADLHLVHLPVQTAVDGSGGSLGVHVLDGVRSILHHAAAEEKVMIVISQGMHAGPHDGSTLLESALDELLERRPTDFAIVIGAGNGRRTADSVPLACHAIARADKSRPVTLQLMVPPGDDSDTFVELWYPPGAALSIQLTPPNGQLAGPGVNAGESSLLLNESSVSAAVLRCSPAPGGHESMALVALSPTQRGPAGRSAQPGLWQVTLQAQDDKELEVHAWVERDDPLIGSDAQWPRFLGHLVTEEGTINSVATGQHTLVASAMRRHNGSPSPYASLGPTRNLQRSMPCPNAWAAADDSSAMRGVRAAGVPSGKLVRMSGTSVAAPTLARQLFNAMMNRTTPQNRDDWQTLIEQVASDKPQLVRSAS